MQVREENDNVEIGEWQMIPRNAFLYFPSGEQIKSGQREKAWRKIFENGQPYDDFEIDQLKKLQNKLQADKIDLHPWFTKCNKLRFLQANKYKLSDTCKSIKEACAWRKNDFPVEVDDKIQEMLNSGAFYFCGRDNKYRPILIADIEKFNSKDIDRIPAVLMILIEFMIKQLLIPGQIENYVLILNLQAFSMSMKDTVMKIISFTSNTYRGRLFASYLLSMPGILKFAWDSIASKFVSENTLRKIKISKNLVHEDMWTHIDEKIIERKYGGKMENIDSSFWPPSSTLMNFQSPTAKNQLIQESQYQQRYKNGMLNGRKVQKRLLAQQQTKSIAHVNKSIVRSEANINENIQEQLPSPQIEEKEKKHIHLQNILQFTNMPKNLIKQQKVPHIKRRPFQLFFQSDDYQNIMLKK